MRKKPEELECATLEDLQAALEDICDILQEQLAKVHKTDYTGKRKYLRVNLSIYDYGYENYTITGSDNDEFYQFVDRTKVEDGGWHYNEPLTGKYAEVGT